ncbi:sulfotransferase 6B1-like [Acipenser oxyrinchus oxyrinchus]|uniref:Sulfotransferase n=1 Tax=Acipenser oxyrinchus oxyrinchus TaxID=40147 RepID=A0AAD8G392_ACIOX|nr:sulfotransferase 6B1-like [Acipenser oxyrinchus oxyrinchus]KAK1167086.1 sulfotransferase 6B1-like [Acipenser oxyrinchus oxyrinchus]
MPEQTELIHTFNGIPFSTRVSKELLQSLDTFEAREDDVLLVSYPKSGTHWLTEIMKNLYHSHSEANGVSKVTLTSPLEFGDLSRFDELRNLPNKRLIPTHLNYEMIPVQFKTKKCKMIYVIRNPKDTAVSLYHYYKQNPNLPKIEKWSTFLEMFLKGEVVCGSWIDHVLSWEKSKNDENVLVLYYESLKEDLPKHVKEISTFLGINVTEDQVKDISKKSSFSEMKEKAEKEKVNPNHTVCVLTSNKKLIFRKGTVGDWKNHFTSKQNAKFDELFKEKINSSELARRVKYES